LVAIRITDPMLTDYKKDCVINHYENVWNIVAQTLTFCCFEV
jgi:hypothetical protein